MRNCYGMKGIRCFFNLPFLKLKVPYPINLQFPFILDIYLKMLNGNIGLIEKCCCLQRQYIIQQLKENEADLDAADQELDLVNSEQNYDSYSPHF